ncbi:MAG: hypothetical protein AB7F35_11285 [Acetobacteraceae bacterium]
MPQASVTIYQPQAISWNDQKLLKARTAVAITPNNASTPMLGTIELTLATAVDMAARTVALSNPQLLTTHFPTLDTSQAAQLEEKIRAALPNMPVRTVPLDTVLLSLKETGDVKPVAVNNDPPVIFYSQKPAALVVFDGEPVLAPVGTTGLSFAVNTNWDVFTDGKGWWLRNGTMWLSAPAHSGPYKPVSRLPASFNQIPNDKNFAEAKKAIPAKAPNPADVPEVLVSTKPAEIIVTAGPPQFDPVPGTGLQVVKNTTSDLYFEPTKGRFYFLVSGRWFSATGLDGPWAFATNDLPPDFALIPPDGAHAHVLPSVPNTAQAQAAVLQAQLPQQATLQRSTAKLTVTYAGQPHFAPIPGTPIKYATNTQFQVLEIGGKYYACYQGAWFVSNAPGGPWVLADSVPQAVYSIPPSSPMYPVTYVTVQSSTPSTVAYAYTAGYMMGFITAGVLVYGTGYYYPPVVIPGRVPAFFPYPYSYAGAVYYNPTNGVWARGGAVYGPYGAARAGAAYNPATGAYARGAAYYGPNGGAGAFSAYNPSTGSYARGSASWNMNGGSANASFYNARTGVSGSTTQNANMYQRWGSSTVSTPTRTVSTQSVSGARGSAGSFQSSTGAQGAGYNTARGQGGAVKTQGGDIYAGRDGNAYKHTSDGWQTWNNGSWQSVQPPSGRSTETARTTSTQGTPPARQAPTQAAPARSGATEYQRPSTAPTSRPAMDRSSFQQLEQDRRARFGSERPAGGFRESYGGREFGGRFGR